MLGLEISGPRRGAKGKQVEITKVRELDVHDMHRLTDERMVKRTPIKRISERHHALARNMALGMKIYEAAFVSGYSPDRAYLLQEDPAFNELVEFYKADAQRHFSDLHGKLAALSMDAVEELHSRLEDTPEDLTTNQLVEITKMAADRTGFGPQTKNTNLNVNVDLADRLQRARERVASRQQIILDITPEEG